jgi:hypothetical protein
MWWTEEDKEQEMVEHEGFDFLEMCAIENFIETVKHRTGTIDDIIKSIRDAKSYEDAFGLVRQKRFKELIEIKKKFEEMPLTEYEGDYK